MTRQQFQILVVLNQLLAFSVPVVQALTDGLLPPELHGFLGLDQSVLEDPAPSTSDDVPGLLRTALMFGHVVASVGLCLGRRWGRTLLALCLFSDWLLVAFAPYFVDTPWTVLASYAFTITEGMVLGLAYFSHLRRLFEPRHDA
jgi:hypothetical protein